MIIDDIIYVSLLLACIAFGPYFRKIKDPLTKQWASTGAGFLVAVIVSGWHVTHPILITLINAVILTLLSRRIRHIVAFIFSFFYLFVIFRLSDWYGTTVPSTHANLILMMMTLKYAGLGFEMKNAVEELNDNPESERYNIWCNVGFFDVIHYGFSYMGILTGPYYRYRTWWDCVHSNAGDFIDCWGLTRYKLKIIVVSSVLYLISEYYYPASYALTDEFHARSIYYRIWYVYPVFTTFRTRLYAGMTFSECCCQMAGLGAYPTVTETRTGHGPKDYKTATALARNPEKLKEEELNFDTVRCMNIWGVETSYLVRNAMKVWNMTVQYWMATYVYKTFPNKALRAPVVFILSAAWHGYAFGYYVGISSVVLFLPVEDIYVKLYKQSPEHSLARRGWWTLLFFLRYTCMAYLSFAMLLLSLKNIFLYYNSVYWAGHVFAAFLYVIGRFILKPRHHEKMENKNQ